MISCQFILAGVGGAVGEIRVICRREVGKLGADRDVIMTPDAAGGFASTSCFVHCAVAAPSTTTTYCVILWTDGRGHAIWRKTASPPHRPKQWQLRKEGGGWCQTTATTHTTTRMSQFANGTRERAYLHNVIYGHLPLILRHAAHIVRVHKSGTKYRSGTMEPASSL